MTKQKLKFWSLLGKKKLRDQKKILGSSRCKDKIIRDLQNLSKQIVHNKVFNRKNSVFKPSQRRILKNNKKLLRALSKTKNTTKARSLLKRNLKGGFISLIPVALSAVISAVNALT